MHAGAQLMLWRHRRADRMAAEGHAEAQYHLGSGYDSGYYGLDVQEADAEAVKWYRMRRSRGHATAQWASVRYRKTMRSGEVVSHRLSRSTPRRWAVRQRRGACRKTMPKR